MRVLTYTAGPQDAGRTVRSAAPRCFSLGTHLYRQLKLSGGIRVNGVPVHVDYCLSPGDVLSVHIPQHAAPVSSPAACSPGDPALPPSRILYADDDLLIVSKGAPLPTLPSIHIATATLREQLITLLGADPASFRYHPVNRLDKGTSGLMCVARHAHAQHLLTEQLHTGAFIREYLAVAEGVPPALCGTVDAPIARLGSGARRAVHPDGQHAVTHYTVLGTANGRSLIRLRLETGRTHQIRVHLAHIGCPICGDYLYGTPLAALGARFALHSASVRLTQPISGSTIALDDPLPPSLAALLHA